MISVEPTRDVNWMWDIARHPDVYPYISEPGISLERDAIVPVVENPKNHFLKGSDSGKPMGFFAFHDAGEGFLDLHICILPEFRGKSAFVAFHMALVWVFNSTAATAVLAVFKACRRDVKYFIAQAGFRKMWQTDGVCLYKLEREKLCLG